MKLTFLGAARIVTGSCYLIESGKENLLVDCGMFQGKKETTKLNYEPLKFDPKKISHILLTHAHIDHSGLIPRLWKEGFRGKIIATSATIDLCMIMLEDSANIQSIDTKHENKRRAKEGLKPREPIYSMEDARACCSLFEKIDYNKEYNVSKKIKAVYKDAGHIIGSAIIELYVNENSETKKIVFSGDIGQWDVPIINDPTLIEDADYLLIESTYGDRLHEDIGIRDDLLLESINRAYSKGGKLLIPSFAIERTQEILYALNAMTKKGIFPDERVFLDSPLAIKATDIFERRREFFDKEALAKYKSPFKFSNLDYTLKPEDSMKLNDYKKPCIIIAGSGMCTGGRIRHHIRHGISNPKNTVLFVGFQAEGTLGRVILNGAKKIRMMGMEIDVKADIEKISGFSAHADYEDLLKWISGFKKKPKKVFVVHGEEHASESFKRKIEKKGFKGYMPKMYEQLEI